MLNQNDQFPPLGSGSGHRSKRINSDGLIKYNPSSNSNSTTAYAQLFRSGRIEAVNTTLFRKDKESGNLFLLTNYYEREIIDNTTSYLQILDKLGIETPLVFLLSLIGAKGAFMEVNPLSPMCLCDQNSIDRDVLIVPDILIEEYECNMSQLLQPAFDAIWNACGFEKSINYDKEGNWISQH